MRLIETIWPETGRPCSERAIERALAYAESRRRALDEGNAVLARGDAHCWNALLVPGGGPPRFKFVDPDGLFIERAYDLAISMREWAEDLPAGDPAAPGFRRCQRLADLTGINPGPIWEWGFVERVSTGLLCLRAAWVARARCSPSQMPRRSNRRHEAGDGQNAQLRGHWA